MQHKRKHRHPRPITPVGDTIHQGLLAYLDERADATTTAPRECTEEFHEEVLAWRSTQDHLTHSLTHSLGSNA